MTKVIEKLSANEYAIIDNNGQVTGTTDRKEAINHLFQGKRVFNVKTYELKKINLKTKKTN